MFSLSNKILVNKYVLLFAEHLYLPWYERDGLMSYIDSLNCQEFLNDTDEHFKKAKVINFNMIHHKCRGDPLQKDLKTYQSVQKKDLAGYNQQQKKNIISSALRCERKNIYVEKTVTYKHFKSL